MWTVIKRSFKQFYEHLFLLVLVNIIWFVLVSLSIFVGYAGLVANWIFPMLIPLILMGPLCLSGLNFSWKAYKTRGVNFKYIFTGIKKYFKRGLLAFLFSIIVYLILMVDFYFFFQRGTDSLLMVIISVIFMYLIIFFSMFQLFFWGLLTIQQGENIKKIIKRSFLLVLHNPGFSILWLLVIIIIGVLLTLTGVGMAVAFMSVMALMILNGVELILEQYGEEGES